METQGKSPSPQVHKTGCAEKPLYIMGTSLPYSAVLQPLHNWNCLAK